MADILGIELTKYRKENGRDGLTITSDDMKILGG